MKEAAQNWHRYKEENGIKTKSDLARESKAAAKKNVSEDSESQESEEEKPAKKNQKNGYQNR